MAVRWGSTLQAPECCRNISFLHASKDYCTGTAVASMRRTEALASVKFYQILSIFIFFIRLIILEDFIWLISYNGPCVRLGCSFFLATALTGSPSSVHKENHRKFQHCFAYYELFLDFVWEIQHKYSTEICTIVQYRTINCTYVNLRILLFFSVWPGLNSWPFYLVLWLLVCSVLFSYIKRSNAGDYV